MTGSHQMTDCSECGGGEEQKQEKNLNKNLRKEENASLKKKARVFDRKLMRLTKDQAEKK